MTLRTWAIGIAVIWCVDLCLALGAAGRYGPSLQGIPPLLAFALAVGGAGWAAAVAIFLIRRRHGRAWPHVLCWHPPSTTQLVRFSGLGFGIAAVALGVHHVASSGGSALAHYAAATPAHLLLVIALALCLPPLEEIYYRGFIFPTLLRYGGTFVAIGLTTVWFVIPHLAQSAGDPVSVGIVAALGLCLTWLRYRTRSLTPSLISHWTYNLGVVVCAVGGHYLST